MPDQAAGAKALTKNPLGSSGDTVAENVKDLLEKQNLTYAAVAKRLEQIERPIPTLGLRKIVAKTRRVDVDDLVGLAVALRVSPLTLLMPKAHGSDDLVAVTGVIDERVKAGRLWNWLVGRLPLIDETAEQALMFVTSAVPGWLIRRGEVAVVESGVEPHVTQIVRWSGGEHILGGLSDGDD